MSQRQTATGLLLIVGGLCGTVALLANAQPKPTVTATARPRPAFKPVIDLEDMMEGQKKLFTDIKEGLLDKQWEEAEAAAWILAEIANVNQYQHQEKDYKRFAHRMSGQCVELAKRLKKRESGKAVEALENVRQTCTACHDQFRKDEEEHEHHHEKTKPNAKQSKD
ncbi:MAG: hypothetical protein ACE5E1_06780 [Phycisphaerae bacterium]